MTFFLFLFILLISFVLLLYSYKTENYGFRKLIIKVWIFAISFVVLGNVFRLILTKKVLVKEDYYGEYIVNRNYFAGKQADWQYNNFRFQIKENDSIYFYVTNKEKIHKTYKGIITTKKPFNSERLIIIMQPSHHIIESNPTIYRNTWGFDLVFYSNKFNNVYFTKGKWKRIED